MKSIQASLIYKLTSLMILLSILGGTMLFLWLRHSMIVEFDRSLTLRAQSLESLVQQTSRGRLDVDVDLKTLREFIGPTAREYYLLEDSAGKRIGGSSAAKLPVDGPTENGFWETRLPSGVAARAAQIAFVPALQAHEEDEETVPAAHEPGQPIKLRLTIARDRQTLTNVVTRIGLSIAIAGFLVSAAAVVAAVHIVRLGLRPLVGVADQVRRLDFHRQVKSFPTVGLPAELLPIVHGLNEMINRVYQAFIKERQFTSAVSHELRTPLAELRSAVDIALRDPGNAALQQRALDQAREIAIQMQTMFATLLEIVSNQRAAESIQSEAVQARSIFDQAIEANRAALDANAMRARNEIPAAMVLRANAALLRGIADNLIKNAAAYSRTGSMLKIGAFVPGDSVRIRVENEPAVALADRDIEQMFEAFWRKDPARSGSANFGLGLTVVQTYCAAMAARVGALRLDDGRLAIELNFAAVGPDLNASPTAIVDIEHSADEPAVTF